MRVLFIGLGSIFTEGLNYQDNYFFEIAKENHEVLYIADDRKFVDGVITKVDKLDLAKEVNGVIRYPLFNFGFDFITNSIRFLPNLYKLIDEFNPDIIYHHSIQSVSLLTLAKYKKRHPNVKIFADNHADSNNSGKSLPAKTLHYLFYRYVIKKVISSLEKVFYITFESKVFIEKYYKITNKKLEFMPLGGSILTSEEYEKRRKFFRNKYKMESIIYCHTGKLDNNKRTLEILKAFEKSQTKNQLFLAGSISDELKLTVDKILKNNNNIHFIGWLDNNELINLFCAADVYIQLGSQSASMQNAMCSKCALALYPHKSHVDLLNDKFFRILDEEDLERLISEIDNDPSKVDKMRKISYQFAKTNLDNVQLFNKVIKNHI